MFRNKFGEDSLIATFIHLKIPRRYGVKSLRTLEEGEFKVPTDGCIKVNWAIHQLQAKQVKVDNKLDTFS